MNGRIYDPRLGRFLSPDPYIQAPGYTQSYNRYSYVWNNPMKFVDPTGELIDPLGLFLIGSFIIGALHFGQQPDGSFDWGEAAKGGLASMAIAGTMVASFMLPAIIPLGAGALPGLIHAGAQFASTAINTGAWNWMTTGSFTPNWMAAAISATPGLIMAGIGGVNALKHGGDFWTGEGMMHDVFAVEIDGNEIRTGRGMEFSQDYAEARSSEWFSSHKKFENKLYADGSIPPDYSKVGDHVLNKNGNRVAGTSHYLGFGKKTDIYLYKAAFQSKEILYFSMGHEYLHAAYYASGFVSGSAHHPSIHMWEYHQALEWNYDVAYYKKFYDDNYSSYNPKYHYSTQGFFIRLIRPWP